MPSPKDDVAEAAKEGAKEGAALARNQAKVKDLTLKERAMRKAATVYRRAADEARSSPNLTQILVAGAAGIGGSMGGYKLNQYLRAKTAEWGWVNEEGERSIGSVLLADVMPPVVGVGLTILGAFIKNGALSSAVMGLGMGFAGGSITSTAFGPD